MKKEYINYESLLKKISEGYVSYSDLLFTVEWKNKRDGILQRDGHRCTKCRKEKTWKHFDEESRKIFHLWFSAEKPKLVKREDGTYEEGDLPEIMGTDKAHYMHVHHRYYILNRLPWEYDDEALITLCNWCHWELHKNEEVDVLYEDGLTKAKLNPCIRCNGAGWFPEHSHVQGDTCFRCRGSRYEQPLIRISKEI